MPDLTPAPNETISLHPGFFPRAKHIKRLLTVGAAKSAGFPCESDMNGSDVLSFGRDAIWLTIQLCTPILLVGLVVGVAIGLFQALTQIQEQTLIYAPKIIAIFLALLLLLPLMGSLMSGFMHEIVNRITTI